MKNKKCGMCGKEFTPSSHNQKYCPGCQVQAHTDSVRRRYRRKREAMGFVVHPRKDCNEVEYRGPQDGSICWDCRNAVPDGKNGCPWSMYFEAVPGWTVKSYINREGKERTKVLECPRFKR